MSSPNSSIPAVSPSSPTVSVWPHGPDSSRPDDREAFCDRCVARVPAAELAAVHDDGAELAVCAECYAELAAPAPIPPCPYCGGTVREDDDMLVCQNRPGPGANCRGAWPTVDALAREAAELAATRAAFTDRRAQARAWPSLSYREEAVMYCGNTTTDIYGGAA